MGGGSIRAAAKAAVIGGYRSAAAVRRAIHPSSQPATSSHSSPADGRHASTFAVDDWVIPDREVFGPVPTHEEAMATALDLTDAFEIAKVESHVARLDNPKTHTKVAQLRKVHLRKLFTLKHLRMLFIQKHLSSKIATKNCSLHLEPLDVLCKHSHCYMRALKLRMLLPHLLLIRMSGML